MRFCFLALLPGVLLAGTDAASNLHDAVYRDDVATVRQLLDKGANVKAANDYGVTPLSLACTNGNAEMAGLLLKAGADPNAALPSGETVLMTAARTGAPAAVKALLVSGAKVNATEEHGQTALMWAAAEGHANVVELLIEFGADFRARVPAGFTPLLFAVREGQAGSVRSLLKAGADINDTIKPLRPGATNLPPTARVPRPGTSALHLAVVNGHFELASMLLDAGADPNPIGPGYTPLHIITQVRKPGLGDNDPAPQGSGKMTSLEMVKKLVEKGADVNARMTRKINIGLTSLNTIGATPFLMAARTGDADLMRALAALGADPLIPNVDKSTPLMAAAGLGTRSPGEDAGTESEILEAVQVALELGNDINAVDSNGETAMHSAAYKNLPKVVEFLASKGASIEVWNKKNRFGWTPLTIAQGYRFGNYKPSPVTTAAFLRVMEAAGVKPSVEAVQGISDYAPKKP